MLKNVKPDVLIIDADFVQFCRQLDEPIPPVILLDVPVNHKNVDRDGSKSWEVPPTLVAETTDLTQRELDEVVIFMHTSGSTGKFDFVTPSSS